MNPPRDPTASEVRVVHLPAPSAWPFVLGGGITLLAFGILTNGIFSLVGLVLMAVSIGGWIQELRHESE